MSALLFAIDPEAVYLATDTLAISGTTHTPFLFLSKMIYLPHLGMVCAGTGLANAISAWFVKLNSEILARDFDELDNFVPEMLRETYRQAQDEFGEAAGTVTLYHFGYSEEHGQMIAHVYRSTSGFASETLLNGIGIKPAPLMPPIEVRQVPDDFVSIISQLKDEDQGRPLPEKIGIGGDIHFAALRRDSCEMRCVVRFDEWEDQFTEMSRNLPDNAS